MTDKEARAYIDAAYQDIMDSIHLGAKDARQREAEIIRKLDALTMRVRDLEQKYLRYLTKKESE